MSNLIEYFWKDDPLKTADGLIKSSNFGPPSLDREVPINISLLFIAAVFLAVTMSLYGGTGATLTQHLFASIILIFVGYIGAGAILISVGKDYSWVNNRLRCFLTCFIATLTASLIFVYFSESITDAGIAVVEFCTKSETLRNILPNAAPPLTFSTIGCVAIYRLYRDKDNPDGLKSLKWMTRLRFLVYWLCVSTIFYFIAFDRLWFFLTVVRPILTIKFV